MLLPQILAAAEPPPPPDPAETPVRDFLKGRVEFPQFVFAGPQFPTATFVPADAAQQFPGPHRVVARFFDRDGKEVREAADPGPYAAVVELVPEKGRTTRRLVTLFREAKPADSAGKFDAEQPAPFANWSGLSPAVLKRQSELIAATCKNRSIAELARDPKVARLLAGLTLSPADSAPPRKNADAFAQERQWWVDLKRTLAGTPAPATPLLIPSPRSGPPAPVVREGTLAEAGMKPDTAEKIDAALQVYAADTDQAFAVCVVRRGVIVIHKAYGTRDGRPMTLTDKSWMASVTKTMSATLMMMLVDRGLASLDDPITKFLPQFRGLENSAPITLRHLYTHTSGLAEWPSWSDELADMEDQVADAYPFVQAGKKWAYSGQGYTLGGKIIEALSGEAIPAFYLRHMLQPLGMDHTDVIATHADAMTAPLDMARFAQMLLNLGSYGDLEFFRPETFDAMLPKVLTDVLGPEATKTFGIGLDGQPGSGKFGHGTASAATFHIDANEQLVTIMCRNKIGTNYDKYHGKFHEAIAAGIIR